MADQKDKAQEKKRQEESGSSIRITTKRTVPEAGATWVRESLARKEWAARSPAVLVHNKKL